MNLKKIASGLTALACCAGLMTVMPDVNKVTYAAEIVHNDFEVTYEGWHGTEMDKDIEAVQGIGFNGSRGMLVSQRKSPKIGAEASKGLYLVGGVKYNYSFQVYSETDENFHVNIITIDMDTQKETKKLLVSKKVKAGEWTELSADYTAPDNDCEFRITITTDTTNDFIFDEVSITTAETGKANAVFAATAQKGLKDEFVNYFRIGNILNAGWGQGGTVANSAITANIIKDCNSIECENETKADSVLVQSQCSGTNVGVSLNAASTILDFCVKNNIGFRGHAFVWHSQTPAWFFKENYSNNGNWVSSSVMDQRLESYLKNLFALYKQKYPTLDLYAYDICNECVSDDSNRTANYGGAREPGDNNVSSGKSAWVQVYGSNAFVEKAFTYARKYAPSTCKLYYNDYNEYWDHKRDCIYNMCKDLYQKEVLDGVGMQSHIDAGPNSFSGTQNYINAMKKYLSIGCDVQISELDIALTDSNNNIIYTEQQQADKYKAIFKAAMDWNDNPQSSGRVTLIAIWGPNDANSWLNSNANALLYDKNNQPKLAYTTLTSMIPQSQWGDGTKYSDNRQPTTVEPNKYGWYYQCGYENNEEGWEARGPVTLTVSEDSAFVGSKSLLVSGRSSSWNGACYSLNPNAFAAGKEYSFSTNVYFASGNNIEDFFMKLEYTDSSGETNYSTIAEGSVVKGEWTQLVNTNYKIPEGASNCKVYVETKEGCTVDFYIDESIGAVGGTGILGAKPSKKIIIGDVSCDGVIDSIDIALLRFGIVNKSFADSSAEAAADVDQNGLVGVADLVALQNYVLEKITVFPVAEKIVDTAAMDKLFSGIKTQTSLKKDGENNTIFTQRFGADPGFMVYKDRLYVFTTNDSFEYDSNGNMKENSYDVQTLNCHSSSDLVNWTDHGAIPIAGKNKGNGPAKWAGFSWAPDACWKTINGKDKFFIYFADSAGGIGVVTADDPAGPYTDPLGHALITKSTPNCNVEWLFDPAVFVDDDGKAYLYFGGGVPSGKDANPDTARCVQLGDDMISIVGTPKNINPPYLFEDSSILKIDNKYYYSYCTNWNTGGNPYGFANAEIAYMTADNPLGPFTYQGVMFKNPASYQLDGGGNNHHSLVKFKNQYYLLYHSRVMERRMGINGGNGFNYRSTHIDKATVSNGKVTVNGTMKGVEQLELLNPYNKVQAETMSNQAGINVKGVNDTVITDVQSGDWIKVSGVNFSKGAKSITAKAASSKGGVIKVCTGSPTGTAIGYIEVKAGSNSELTFPVNSVNGTKDLYFVFSGDVEFDWWRFTA